jgi:GAF domain-containing protein
MTRPKQSPTERPGKRRGKKVQVLWGDEAPFHVPIPADEPERVADLKEYEVLDTPREEAFDNITLLASHICGTPIALITLVDSDRQWFKSKVGVTVEETSRDIALCAHAIVEEDLFIIPDASRDVRFANNPLVKSHPRIRFYAGAPLISRKRHALGTLCVIDRVPRKLTKDQLDALRALSRQVMAQLEGRREIKQLERQVQQRQRDHAALEKQLNQANARKRAYEEAFRRVRHEVHATNKAILNLVDASMVAAPACKGPLRSIRNLAHSLLGLAP